MSINFKHIPNVYRYNTLESLDDSDYLRERTFEGISVDVGVVLGVLVSDVSVHLRIKEWVTTLSRTTSTIYLL